MISQEDLESWVSKRWLGFPTDCLITEDGERRFDREKFERWDKISLRTMGLLLSRYFENKK